MHGPTTRAYISSARFPSRPSSITSSLGWSRDSNICGRRFFSGGLPPIVKEKNGFYSMTMTNMPAYREEPRMPPEDQVRTWVLIYYTLSCRKFAAKILEGFGQHFLRQHQIAHQAQ